MASGEGGVRKLCCPNLYQFYVKSYKNRIYGVYECSHLGPISRELSPLLVLDVSACRLNHAKNQRKNTSGTQPGFTRGMTREAEGGERLKRTILT